MHTIRLHDDETPQPLRIGNHEITASSQPYVVAEAGVNHEGKLDQAKRLVDAAREAGAQAIKFQVFKASTLVSKGTPSTTYQQQAGCPSSADDMLRRLELTENDLAQLLEHCRACKVEFLTTPFGLGDLRLVLELGAAAIKVASTDLNNVPLLEAIIACGVPLILSTGASEIAEIDEAVSLVDHHEACDRLILLHCVSCYPTPSADAALSTIRLLAQRYRVWVGSSDHTESIDAGGLAVACGARLLEKHLTLDRSLPGPDQAFSLPPQLFADYVEAAKRCHVMLGEPRQTVLDCEKEVRRLSRRSVVAAVQIREGQTITEDMLTVKRPAGGIAPSDWGRLIGRRALVNIAEDTQLKWDMVG